MPTPVAVITSAVSTAVAAAMAAGIVASMAMARTMTGRMALTCFGSSGCQNSESGYCGEQCNQEFHDRASGWILICWRMLRTFYQTGRKFLYSGGIQFFDSTHRLFPFQPN
jgi:hypothetical protein